ncbi:MAG: hypothetical protein AAF721_28880 [Myxococcota bacterium]
MKPRNFPLHLVLLLGLCPLACAGDDAGPAGDTQAAVDSSGGGGGSGSGGADTTAGAATLDEEAILAAAMAFATTMDRVSDEPRTSQHGLADTVNFYVGAEHKDMYLSVDPDAPAEITFPEGTLLVKENLNDAGESDGFFAMYKAFPGYDEAGKDWYWLRVDGEGATGNSGKVGFCIDCHGGGSAAVSDLVFGVPLDNRL